MFYFKHNCNCTLIFGKDEFSIDACSTEPAIYTKTSFDAFYHIITFKKTYDLDKIFSSDSPTREIIDQLCKLRYRVSGHVTLNARFDSTRINN